MIRTTLIVLPVLAFALLTPAQTLTPVHAAGAVHSPTTRPKRRHCDYGYAHSRCRRVPRHRKFDIEVEGVGLLQGTGTPDTEGTDIVVARVDNPCPDSNAGAFKLLADGPIPPLHLITPGTLYEYDPGSNTCHRISKITGPGVYEVVKPPKHQAKGHNNKKKHGKKKP